MARKRKRAEKSYCSRKVLKLSGEAVREHDSILHSYYEKVLSLREYLLSRLPTNSRVRRRNLKIQDLDNAENILDAYLVGVSREPSRETCRSRQREFQTFTQSPAYSSYRGTDKDQLCSLQEVSACFSLLTGGMFTEGQTGGGLYLMVSVQSVP